MTSSSASPAAISQPTPQVLALSGHWTARAVGGIEARLAGLQVPAATRLVADGTGLEALDTAGAWLLHNGLQRLRSQGVEVSLQGLRAPLAGIFDGVAQHLAQQASKPPPAPPAAAGVLQQIGRATAAFVAQGAALLAFVGESATVLAGSMLRPSRLRWRPILYNIRSAGFDALPIVGLLSFLLGIVVAYQAADQLRRYGANIFVADLVGLSMLREFAPLMAAIIVAGRSGSAYAAQIGTMVVNEEIDAMRTMAISPMEVLVLPKLIALVVALPLLTVFADVLGVAGGMVMASAQLDVGYGDFLDRFAKAVSVSSFLTGIGKAPVFAAIIVMVGCFQGMRTRGGADSVGRQTTRSVVQSIFLVIVADALFSVAFSLLGI